MMGLTAEYAEPAVYLVAWGVRFLVQSTLLIGLGLLVCRRLGRQSAALRSMVLRGTLLAALICPVVSGLAGLGGVRLAIPSEIARVSTSPPRATVQPASVGGGRWSVRIGARVPSRPTGVVQTATDVQRPSMRIGLSDLYILLGTVWIVGAIVLLGCLGYHCLQAWRLRNSACAAPEGAVAIAYDMATRMGLEAPPVMISPAVKSPLLVGVVRPAILLPAACPEIAEAQVFAHELAHLSRRDCLWSLGYRLARVLCFFQPLMWILGRHLEQASEEACDDFVLSYVGQRRSYAARLVEMALPLAYGRPQPLGIGAVTLRSSLGRRVQRIVNAGADHAIRPRRVQILCMALLGGLAVFCVSFLGVRVAAATQEQILSAVATGEPNIAPLIRMLSSDVWRRREQAAIELAQTTGVKTDAIPALIDALADDQWQVRKAAAVALTTAGPSAANAVPALITALSDEEWHVRRPAAEALAAMGPASEPAVPALSDAVRDDEWHVRWAAATALAAVGPASEPTVPALLAALDDEEWQVRRAAALALVAIGPASRPSMPQLLRRLDDEQWHVRESAALALGAIGPDAAGAIAALIERLEDSEMQVRRAAASALESIAAGDKAAIPEIIGALRDSEWQRRQTAAQSLERLL